MDDHKISMTQRQYRLDFRKEEIAFTLERANAGSAISLVGIGSVGKSNLLSHLLNPVVHTHYLGSEASATLKLINIDANMLAPLAQGHNDAAHHTWAGLELMMHRLFLAFYPFDTLPQEDARAFYSTYQALQDGRNPLFASLAPRYFELGLTYFIRRGFRIVFLLDEFETLLSRMPITFFLILRGLRDVYKGSLSYITFARAPIPSLVERMAIDALAIEPFAELFNDNVRYIGPYNRQDASDMMASLAKRSNRALPEQTVTALLDATGGFAGLIRAGWALIESQPGVLTQQHPEDLPSRLLQRRAIQLECQVIWDSLNTAEQTVLHSVVRQTPYTIDSDIEDAITMLLQKHLLRLNREQNRLAVDPPLFNRFIQTKVER